MTGGVAYSETSLYACVPQQAFLGHGSDCLHESPAKQN